jgi:hypothetical protein
MGRGVDKDEIANQEASQDEVEVECGGFEAGQENGEGDGGEEDPTEEGGAVPVVEVVAGFEILLLGEPSVELPGVHQAGVH